MTILTSCKVVGLVLDPACHSVPHSAGGRWTVQVANVVGFSLGRTSFRAHQNVVPFTVAETTMDLGARPGTSLAAD
jgi:hypothetical protein